MCWLRGPNGGARIGRRLSGAHRRRSGRVRGSGAAFAYLTARTVRNRCVAQLHRLRSPRYVIAVAVACGYFFLLLYRPTAGVVDVPAVLPAAQAGALAGIQVLSACGLALFTAKWWLVGSANSTLAFSAAEVQFLFPAPVNRRTLVLYRIGRTQLALLISAVFITVLARRAGAHLSPLLRAISLWLLFCTLSLHQNGLGARARRCGTARTRPAS